MTNPTTNKKPETETEDIFCPKCDVGFCATADEVHDEITKCPECGTECCVPMVSVDRVKMDEGSDAEHFGFFPTMAAARTAINNTIATEWGDNSMEMAAEPEAGGFWVDGSDSNQWFIETE